jgi:glycosyltransferase involved in cell wall biosynthesis
MTATSAAEGVQVLLVGNYRPDAQASMQRFATLMHDGLVARGAHATVVAPSVRVAHRPVGIGGVAKWLGYVDKFLLFPPQLRRAAEPAGARRVLVHICDHSNAIYVPRIRHLPHLVTCHDLLAVRSARGEFAETHTRWSGRLLQAAIVRGLRQAGTIICDSTATRTDVLRMVNPDQNHVGMIHPCVSPEFARETRAAPSPRLAAWLATNQGYLLHVGGNQWYKNRAGLLAIYAALVERMPGVPALVIAGSPLPAPLRAFITTHGLSPRVVEWSGLDDCDLAALYGSAALMVFPSWAEGFGWPVLEALACGCRVVAADRAPLTEIGGGAVTYIDPRDPAGCAALILEVLRESHEARQAHVAAGFARAAQFSRDRMIDAYVRVYEGVLSGTAVAGPL